MADSFPAEVDSASIEAALSRGEDGVLDELLKNCSPPQRNQVFRQVGERSMQQQRWKIAVAALTRISGDDVVAQLQHNLARNLIALQEHHPAVYEAVVKAPSDARYQINASASGLPTIIFSDQPGRAVSFSINNDPLKGTAALFAKLKPDIDKGAPLALCGLGDGYLLGALAQKPPALFLSMQQTIHIVEPRPQVLMLCLMMHDYTADAGPIKQPRFRWHVGPQWQSMLRDDLLTDLLTPFPMLTINQGVYTNDIAPAIHAINQQIILDDEQRKREIEAYYATVTREDLVNLFGSFPSRVPRVMLVTTRFSTVLQYSTRDAAEAFGQLGWETYSIIEPSDWQRFSGVSIRKAILEFKPDFVFQIDHLRHEHGDLFPPQLPFACWIQDHLSNLCNAVAGASVGPRDYVLSGMGSLFVQQHGYPRRQVINLPQLSKVPMRPTEWTADGEDLVYVSNWSRTAEQIVPELLNQFSNPPALRPLMEQCCAEIVSRYKTGGGVSTHYDVRMILGECEKKTGIVITDPAGKDHIVNTVFDRLNNTLYRQQALQWAAEISRKTGLRMGLYGRGWDTHPTLSEFARGPVAPGESLQQLTRQSKINLQLEPYACFSHARLLSGLFAGGFFLVRDHPFNHLTQELLNFIDINFDASVYTVEDARKFVKEHHRERLEDLLTRCVCLAEQVDPISMVRDWHRGGTLIPQSLSLPRLPDVLFHDKASFEVAVRRFVNNPELRYEISTEQRQNTQSRLSYRAGLERVTRAIAKLIASESTEQKAQAA